MPVPAFLATLGSGVASALGGGLVGGFLGDLFSLNAEKKSAKQQARNFEYAKQLAQYQADLNYEFWQNNNAYNNPISVMNRLERAGLNPNLAIGAPQNASMPSVSQPSMQQANPTALAAFQMDMAKAYKETALLGEQAESLRLENEWRRKTMGSRVNYQDSLAWRMNSLADIANNEKDMKEYESRMAAEVNNINQYLLHGVDGNFAFGKLGIYGDNEADTKRIQASYLDDLESSELYNSIREKMRSAGLSNQEMSNKILLIGQQIKKYTEDIRYMHSHADVEEFYANLAKNGINPKDPIWARIIVQLLEKAGIDLIGGAADWLNKGVEFGKGAYNYYFGN